MAKAKPSPKKNLQITLISAGFILLGLFVPSYGTELFYGTVGELILGSGAAAIGYYKNRNPVAWFAIGQWSVLLGLIVAMVVPRLADQLCAFCHEGMDKEATVCPHCQRGHVTQAEVSA